MTEYRDEFVVQPTQPACTRCGQAFDESALRNASVPDRNSVIALLANADPDEPMPVEPRDLGCARGFLRQVPVWLQ